jgi:hypothetical protein
MADLTPFRTEFAPRDEDLAARLLLTATLSPDAEKRIDESATGMISAIRGKTSGLGGVEELLREYSLSTPEGLALMVLAEALLRVPDAATADSLIEDKLVRAISSITKRNPTRCSSRLRLGRSASRRASFSRVKHRKAWSGSL